MVFFWACEVTETKAAVVKIPESYVLNVCHATLASASTDGVVSVGIEAPQMDKTLWKGVVAHLGAAAHAHQVKLDLVVGGDASQIKFYVAKGTGKVNLTGYFQPGPPEDLFDAPLEITPAAPAATTTKPQPTSSKNKKRARDEKVTWDQAASDSESDVETTVTKPAEPVQKQAKKEEPKAKTSAPQQPKQPQQNGATAADGDKKKRKKNKNKNKKDN